MFRKINEFTKAILKSLKESPHDWEFTHRTATHTPTNLILYIGHGRLLFDVLVEISAVQGKLCNKGSVWAALCKARDVQGARTINERS